MFLYSSQWTDKKSNTFCLKLFERENNEKKSNEEDERNKLVINAYIFLYLHFYGFLSAGILYNVLVQRV